MVRASRSLSLYRRTGADLPFGDPRGHHGVAMEGYFWRLTDAAAGRVIVAFTGVSRDGDGSSWATIGLAAHPDGFVRTAVEQHAEADQRRLAVRVGTRLRANDDGLDVDLAPDAQLSVRFAQRVAWPRRVLGGVGMGHLVPGLRQYWHPHLLDARVSGEARLGDRTVALDGARAYAEKNWSPKGGFPPEWWWGQGFPDEDVCVAFAGGRLAAFGAGAVVVRIGEELVHAVSPPGLLRVRVDDASWRLQARTLRDVVTVEGSAGGAPYRLPVPVPRERRVEPGVSAMHLAGRLHVRVRRGGRTRFEGASELAGLERGRER